MGRDHAPARQVQGVIAVYLDAPDRSRQHGTSGDDVPPLRVSAGPSPGGPGSHASELVSIRPHRRHRMTRAPVWCQAVQVEGDLAGGHDPRRHQPTGRPGQPLMVLVGDDDLSVGKLDLVARTTVHYLCRGYDTRWP